MFFNSGILSNKGIEKNIGKNILLYPYNPDNMAGGSTYNLTASIVAYYTDTIDGCNKYVYAVEEDDGKKIIRIPSGKTVNIQTEESIYVTKKFCGTYHSKVKMVSKGLGHIATTLDPEYFGTSLIAVHNTSNNDIIIKVGETFCSLMFYELKSKSLARHDNLPGRSDINFPIDELVDINNDKIDSKIRAKIEDWFKEPYRNNKEKLKEVCRKEFAKSVWGRKIQKINRCDFVGTLIISGLLILLTLLSFKTKIKWLDSLDDFRTITVCLGFIFTLKTIIIKNIKDQLEGI